MDRAISLPIPPSLLGEGPIWDARTQTLLHVDILGHLVRRYNPSTGEASAIEVPQDVGCIALCEDGGLIGAMTDGVYRIAEDGSITSIHAPFSVAGRRFNDGKPGPDGCFYAGTIDKELAGGKLYRFDSKGRVTTVLEGCRVSNGLDWTDDGRTMVYCDSALKRVDLFDFDPATGHLSNRRVLRDFTGEQGGPDGLTIDAEGTVWVALWGGYGVVRLSMEGAILARIPLPANQTSCCVFGGKDLDTLYVTSATPDAGATEHDGKTYAIRPGVKGRLPFRFKWEATEG